jgi:hypothetical protein
MINKYGLYVVNGENNVLMQTLNIHILTFYCHKHHVHVEIEMEIN